MTDREDETTAFRADLHGGMPGSLSESGRVLRSLVRNPLSLAGLLVVASVVLVAVLAPHIVPYPGGTGSTERLEQRFKGPSREHWFGTDYLGRDVFSRVLLGARISVMAGVGVTAMAITVGVPVGLAAGLAGGRHDEVAMRLVDIFLAFPTLVLAVLVAAVWGGGLGSAMLAAAFVWWPKYARLMRGEALALRNQLYVEAARALGASHWRIVARHILPNAVSPLTVQASLDVGYMIIFAASLSFVGLGAKPPSAEWGLAISTGRQYMPLYWWLSVFPGLAIVVTVLGFNLLGDGFRDALDPKTRRRGY